MENALKADIEADQREAQEADNSGFYEIFKKMGREFGDDTISREGLTNNPDLSNDNSKYKSYFKDYDHSREGVRKIINHDHDDYDSDSDDITFDVN